MNKEIPRFDSIRSYITDAEPDYIEEVLKDFYDEKTKTQQRLVIIEKQMIKKSNPGIRNQLGNVTQFKDRICSKAELLELIDDIWYAKDRKVFMTAINLLDDIEDIERENLIRLVNSHQFELLEELLKIYKKDGREILHTNDR